MTRKGSSQTALKKKMSNMAMETKMVHYVTKTPDGLYHVQNMVLPMAFKGQHHVHSEEGFNKWVEEVGIAEDSLRISEGNCGCGLSPSQVKSHDGHVSKNTRFEA